MRLGPPALNEERVQRALVVRCDRERTVCPLPRHLRLLLVLRQRLVAPPGGGRLLGLGALGALERRVLPLALLLGPLEIPVQLRDLLVAQCLQQFRLLEARVLLGVRLLQLCLRPGELVDPAVHVSRDSLKFLVLLLQRPAGLQLLAALAQLLLPLPQVLLQPLRAGLQLGTLRLPPGRLLAQPLQFIDIVGLKLENDLVMEPLPLVSLGLELSSFLCCFGLLQEETAHALLQWGDLGLLRGQVFPKILFISLHFQDPGSLLPLLAHDVLELAELCGLAVLLVDLLL
mmetsp:Transcript_34136/g.92419  ORF Transcript_34136/g.92419 Transcript_34136/m.92419 type:complete len:287 (-) Transcript_34136:151-1011(-)